ncbi:hypothetical protein D3C80_1454270 [compost metagenome]
MAEVVTVAHAAATGNNNVCRSQLGAIGRGQFFADERRYACITGASQCHDRRTTAFCRQGLKAGGSNGDDFDCGVRLHGGDGVARIDRALEGIGRLDRNDFGDLIDIQQRCHPRQDVFAVAGGRGQYMAEVATQVGHQWRNIFRELARVGSVVCH